MHQGECDWERGRERGSACVGLGGHQGECDWERGRERGLRLCWPGRPSGGG